MQPKVSWTDGLPHVKDIKWNCDGSLILSTSVDKICKIGQFDSTGHVRPVQSIPVTAIPNTCCWNPEQTGKFAIAGEDKHVDVWDVRASRAAGKIATTASNINLCWSPDENYLAVGNKLDCLSVLDVRTMKQLKRFKAPYELNELAWSSNSDHILVATSADNRGAIDINSFQDGELHMLSAIVCHTSGCLGLKIDRQFNRMAVGSSDFSVSLWDLSDLVCYATVFMETTARSFSYSYDGKYLGVVGDSPLLSVVNCDTASIASTIPIAGTAVAVAWNPKYHSVVALALEDKGKFEYIRIANIPSPE